jgi:hypothetical protein
MVNIWKCLAECIMTLHLSKTRFRKISPAEKKVSRNYKMALFSQSWQKGDKNDHRAKMETNEHESKQMKNTPIYKQPRNVWDDILVSNDTKRTYFNPPPLPLPFSERTTVVSRTAKMELFFPVLKVIQDVLFVRLFLYVADSFFFLFQRVFFSECRNSLFRDRRTRFELRDVERRASKEVKNPVCCISTKSNF